MTLQERRERGTKLIEQMLGPHRAQESHEAWQRASPAFDEYVTEFLAGEVWSRAGLDLRIKSLVTIATLAGMGRSLALELNIRMALNNGATQQDVRETLLQIASFAGFPATWEALSVAARIFDDAGGERSDDAQ